MADRRFVLRILSRFFFVTVLGGILTGSLPAPRASFRKAASVLWCLCLCLRPTCRQWQPQRHRDHVHVNLSRDIPCSHGEIATAKGILLATVSTLEPLLVLAAVFVICSCPVETPARTAKVRPPGVHILGLLMLSWRFVRQISHNFVFDHFGELRFVLIVVAASGGQVRQLT